MKAARKCKSKHIPWFRQIIVWRNWKQAENGVSARFSQSLFWDMRKIRRFFACLFTAHGQFPDFFCRLTLSERAVFWARIIKSLAEFCALRVILLYYVYVYVYTHTHIFVPLCANRNDFPYNVRVFCSELNISDGMCSVLNILRLVCKLLLRKKHGIM
jgi:hypothetical protein